MNLYPIRAKIRAALADSPAVVYSLRDDRTGRQVVIEFIDYEIQIDSENLIFEIRGESLKNPLIQTFDNWFLYSLGKIQRMGIDGAWWLNHRRALVKIAAALNHTPCQAELSPDIDLLNDVAEVFQMAFDKPPVPMDYDLINRTRAALLKAIGHRAPDRN